MTTKTDKITLEIDTNETDFYAKLVPDLLKELAKGRKLLQASTLEHSKTKETLEKLYKDYEASHKRQYRLANSVKFWKLTSCYFGALLVLFTILGVV